MIDQDSVAALIDQNELNAFRDRALNPENPVLRGTAQNPDIYFQAREASNPFYNNVVGIVENYLDEISKLTDRKYGLFDYYGAPDADRVVIAMGSATEALREGIDHLTAKGEKVGLVAVHLYRPFSAKHFLAAVPKTAKKICVLDRTKEPGALGEPLYLDVKDCFYGQKDEPVVVGGRYGLSSKDFTPAQVLAVYENLKMNEPKNHFTVGIVDDVTFTSLPLKEEIALGAKGMTLFKGCKLPAVIEPAGWSNWQKTENEKTARYSEYGNTGPGSVIGKRVAWSRQLSKKEARQITLRTVFGDWNPLEVINH